MRGKPHTHIMTDTDVRLYRELVQDIGSKRRGATHLVINPVPSIINSKSTSHENRMRQVDLRSDHRMRRLIMFVVLFGRIKT